ncbi:uncharacterized protein LOC119740796 [Patiria miniata]|uniref:Uncharacterized protein n=1 Tax=Patiria miniata TaxID=46514 RepID=A0A914B7J6_PATMI|nr:uncharacterized protein LOC119740796 [Patiria miniata]
MMTASSSNEEDVMEAESPSRDLPPDSIQEAISKQWLDSLEETKPTPLPMETSTRLETGIFLHQLTNSVNRALHKQNCTCNGKTYTADELRSISNPAMFAPPSTVPTGKPDQGILSLPPIEDAVKSTAKDILAANNSPLKVYLDRESGKKLGPFAKRGTPGAKPLGGAFVTEKEKEELKLPNIIDVMDVNGNNWKIVQDVSKQRQSRAARYDTKLFDGQSANMQDCRSPPKTPSVNSRIGAVREGQQSLGGRATDDAIYAVTRSNSPRDLDVYNAQGSEAGLHETAMSSPSLEAFTRSEERTKETTDHLPELAPTCTLVQINQSPRLNVDSVQTSYDEAERRSLLLQLNSAVRTGKIPYSEFLKRVSSLAPSFRMENGRDKRARTSSMEQAIPDRSKRQDTRHTSDQSSGTHEPNSANCEATMANTLASSSYTGIYAKEPHAIFPPELQNLYARGGLLKVRTLKIDVGDSLPDNFLTQDREELRVLYPMYGSRVDQERDNMIARMNSLQSKVGKAHGNSPRQNKTSLSNDMRTLLFPSNDVPASASPDDFKLKFKVRKGTDGRNREGRMYSLQGRQSISREGEILDLPPESYVRRISGTESRESFCPSRSFPRQPPTTPADDRYRMIQSQDGGIEPIARSISNVIPENQDADKKQESDKNYQDNSASKTLRVIPEDPLDAVSHANTYGTELHPKRLLDTFGETLGKEETMNKEYVHVVVPTNRRMSGKGRRVSWLQGGDGDDATEFTKSRETLQSIRTYEKPSTPDRLQMAYTISDVSERNSERGDELRPAVKVLQIDNSSIGTFESLARRRPLYVPLDVHGQSDENTYAAGEGRKSCPVTVSTQKVVFVSPLQDQREK